MGTIEKRGPFSFRIGVQVRLPDGSWEWIRDTIHVSPDLSARAARKQAEMALAVWRRMSTKANESQTRKLPPCALFLPSG